MGPDEILPLIRKSVARVTYGGEDYDGIIIACKTDSAFVIADATYYTEDMEITVLFPDNKVAQPDSNNRYIHNGIIGLCCNLVLKNGFFDQNRVSEVDVCEDDADQCEKVYVYEGMFGTINEGYAMKIDTQHYRITNIVATGAEFGSPVVNEDGRLVGICCSFDHGLTAKNIFSIADSIEMGCNRNFTCLTRTLSYLHLSFESDRKVKIAD